MEDEALEKKSKAEKKKALQVMSKIMDHNIKTMRAEADELIERFNKQYEDM